MGESCALNARWKPNGLSIGCSSARIIPGSTLPIIIDDAVMEEKAGKHGSSATGPVQTELLWNVDRRLADFICCFNRHDAEGPGYWETTSFLNEVDKSGTTFYDSITGKALFAIPRGRSYEEWEAESRHHGWPSFRDEEVIWEDFRCLANGEAVSTNGTHLGHCIPDAKGRNRYCINLVSIAGRPAARGEGGGGSS